LVLGRLLVEGLLLSNPWIGPDLALSESAFFLLRCVCPSRLSKTKKLEPEIGIRFAVSLRVLATFTYLPAGQGQVSLVPDNELDAWSSVPVLKQLQGNGAICPWLE